MQLRLVSWTLRQLRVNSSPLAAAKSIVISGFEPRFHGFQIHRSSLATSIITITMNNKSNDNDVDD